MATIAPRSTEQPNADEPTAENFFVHAKKFLDDASHDQTSLRSSSRLSCTTAIGYLVLATICARISREPKTKRFASLTDDLVESAVNAIRAISAPTSVQATLLKMHWDKVPQCGPKTIDFPLGAAQKPDEASGKSLSTAISISRVLSPVLRIPYFEIAAPDYSLPVDQIALTLWMLLTAKEQEKKDVTTEDGQGKASGDEATLIALEQAADLLLSAEVEKAHSIEFARRCARMCELALTISVSKATSRSNAKSLPINKLTNAAQRLWASVWDRQLLLDTTSLYEVYCRGLAQVKDDSGEISSTSSFTIRSQTVSLIKVMVGPIAVADLKDRAWLVGKLDGISDDDQTAIVRCLAIMSRVLAHGDINRHKRPDPTVRPSLEKSYAAIFDVAVEYLSQRRPKLSYRNSTSIAGAIVGAVVKARPEKCFEILSREWQLALTADPATLPGTENDMPVLWTDFDSIVIDLLETSALSFAEDACGRHWLYLLKD